jgi:predicted RNA binding protein YcfA (HicA-like mRNA interferase family)
MSSSDKLKVRLLQGSHLSCREIRLLLTELGYCLARQTGSHEQCLKGGRTFTLASHSKEAPFYILDALRKLMEETNEKK